MTNKDIKKLEALFRKIVLEILNGEPFDIEELDGMTPIFSIDILNDMEDYLGHPVDVMGIS